MLSGGDSLITYDVVDALRLHDVHKLFAGRTVVEGLTLSVPNGSIFGLLGPNGSGKTTTLRMITNIILPDRGRIEVFGTEHEPTGVARVGYLPEERGLYRKPTVHRMLVYLARLKGRNRRDANAEIDGWLDRFGLSSKAHAPIETLSKGMAQRVSFIAAVLGRPSLLVLDEPFSGLDPLSAEALRSAVLDLKRQGIAIVLSTHDMEYAEQLCEQVVLLRNGRAVASGPVASLLQQAGPARMCVDLSEPMVRPPDANDALAALGAKMVAPNRLLIPVIGEPSELLRSLVGIGNIARFEITRPSLREVFLRLIDQSTDQSTEAYREE